MYEAAEWSIRSLYVYLHVYVRRSCRAGAFFLCSSIRISRPSHAELLRVATMTQPSGHAATYGINTAALVSRIQHTFSVHCPCRLAFFEFNLSRLYSFSRFPCSHDDSKNTSLSGTTKHRACAMPTLKGARGGLLAPQTLVEQLRAYHSCLCHSRISLSCAAPSLSAPQLLYRARHKAPVSCCCTVYAASMQTVRSVYSWLPILGSLPMSCVSCMHARSAEPSCMAP